MVEIFEKLLKYKYHAAAGVAISAAAVTLINLAPKLLNVVAYFWPLLLSTTLFLAVIVVFGRISPPPPMDVSGQKAGEGILEFVAGQPHIEALPGEIYKPDQ